MGKLSFGTTGLSYEVRKVDLSSRSAPKCPRCGHTVYFNEEKKALGKSWHAKCFACAVCKKGLDSVNANGHEGEVYCTMCHRREFGPRGYGYAGGAAGLSTETSTLDILLGRSRHSSSSSTSSPKSPMSPVERSWSQSVQQQQPSPQQNGVDKPKVNGQQPAPPQKLVDRDNMECCPRCGRRVYFAEEVKALKRKWHKLCFKCAQCEKMLDAGRCSSHQGEVYCQACYSRSFGPQGYGYGNQTGGNTRAYRVHKSATLPSKASANYRFSNETAVRTDMNGAKREWTDHTEDIRYMKQLAAELDQFE